LSFRAAARNLSFKVAMYFVNRGAAALHFARGFFPLVRMTVGRLRSIRND
jgi:hypothetical protein